jgi:hypothetical protein
VLGGWHFGRSIETALKIGGMWTTGRPSVVVAVEPAGDMIERGDKCRAASLRLLRIATEDEIADAIRRFSAVFSPHADRMAEEQIAWRAALARPKRNVEAVECGLRAALEARKLIWELKRFDSAGAARDAWDAWDASAASAAWAARDAWDAWIYNWDCSWVSIIAIGALSRADEPTFKLWLPILEAFEAGAWLFWITKEEIVVAERPQVVLVNDKRQLHCSDRPAFVWLEIREFYINGVRQSQPPK